MFELTGKTAVVTGGAGVLCAAMCYELASRGVKVAVLDLRADAAQAVADEIISTGGEAIGISVDVLNPESLAESARVVQKTFGSIDILINGAGGNKAEGTATPGQRSFFDLPADAIQWVFNLNLLGTVLSCQAFGEIMVEQSTGTIINISSMSAFTPLTRIAAYSSAKAAVSNFTQWLAVHFAQEYNPNIRVNALAPGFFLTEQNRFLLTDAKSGELTDRGNQIIAHTPMDRFGDPEDLLGTLVWLVSDASKFVTGTVIPIDGGFNAYSGV